MVVTRATWSEYRDPIFGAASSFCVFHIKAWVVVEYVLCQLIVSKWDAFVVSPTLRFAGGIGSRVVVSRAVVVHGGVI